MMNAPSMLAVDPIVLVDPEASSGAGAGGGIVEVLAIAGAVVVLLALVVLAVRLALPWVSLDRDPAERAFRHLARRLRLGRAHRAEIRRLASVAEVKPVAIVLCRGVFSRALGEDGTDTAGAPARDRARLLELEHRLFG